MYRRYSAFHSLPLPFSISNLCMLLRNWFARGFIRFLLQFQSSYFAFSRLQPVFHHSSNCAFWSLKHRAFKSGLQCCDQSGWGFSVFEDPCLGEVAKDENGRPQECNPLQSDSCETGYFCLAGDTAINSNSYCCPKMAGNCESIKYSFLP